MRLQGFLLLMAPVLASGWFCGCASTPGMLVSPASHPVLEHPQGRQGVQWTRLEGPDFEVFYGTTKNRPGAGLGFYMGGHPNRERTENGESMNGKLGVFPVAWKEKSSETSPRIRRDGVIDYKTTILKFNGREQRSTEKIHIWVYGDAREDVEALAEYASGLKFFAEKPADRVIE